MQERIPSSSEAASRDSRSGHMSIEFRKIVDISLELDPKNFAMRTPAGFTKDMQFEMEVIKEHDAPRVFHNSRTLSERGVITMPYLKNLDQIDKDRFTLVGFPLKLIGAEASPIRAVALL